MVLVMVMRAGALIGQAADALAEHSSFHARICRRGMASMLAKFPTIRRGKLNRERR
jgi:hypothetical protein